jgi:hypothetical protein
MGITLLFITQNFFAVLIRTRYWTLFCTLTSYLFMIHFNNIVQWKSKNGAVPLNIPTALA